MTPDRAVQAFPSRARTLANTLATSGGEPAHRNGTSDLRLIPDTPRGLNRASHSESSVGKRIEQVDS